jgi:hypothetical protein
MTIQTSTADAGIKTPSPSDAPPAAPTKEQTAEMVAALPVKSNAAATDLRSAIEQFIDQDAAGVYHRNLVEGMRAQGRQVENELRLFPRQPEEDVALYRFIAGGIIEGGTLSLRIMLNTGQAYGSAQYPITRAAETITIAPTLPGCWSAISAATFEPV